MLISFYQSFSSTLAALMDFFMVRTKRSTLPLASGHKGVIR